MKPFVPNKYPNRFLARPPPDLDQDSDVFIVEKILDRRSQPWGRGEKVEYYIKWEGYPLCESTWESKSKLKDTGSAVQDMMKAIDEHNKKNNKKKKKKKSTSIFDFFGFFLF